MPRYTNDFPFKQRQSKAKDLMLIFSWIDKIGLNNFVFSFDVCLEPLFSCAKFSSPLDCRLCSLCRKCLHTHSSHLSFNYRHTHVIVFIGIFSMCCTKK